MYPLWSLWETQYNPDELQKTRLQQAEVAALLQLLEEQVGAELFFQSLPELDEYTRLGDTLRDHWQDIQGLGSCINGIHVDIPLIIAYIMQL